MRLRATAPALALLAAVVPLAGAAQGSGNFGSTVALGAREVFVGQPLNDYAPGTVYVYRPNPRGEWVEAAKLTAADGAPGDRFGRSLAVDGSRLLVGATVADSSRGAAYVFEKDRSGVWRQVARLVPDGAQAEDANGRMVALRGDVAAVAAWGDDSSRGAVHLFRRGAAGWTQEAKLQPADVRPGNQFGNALAIQEGGDRVLVGMINADSATGAVYVFERDSTGAWRQAARLSPPNAPRFARFGASIVLRDDEALVGAPAWERFTGAVYVFRRDSSTGRWQPSQRLLPFDALSGGAFGFGLSYDGREALVTARSGVYRMQRDTSGWTSATKVPYGEAADADLFGSMVAVAGDLAVIGMGNADLGEGAAAVFTRGATGAWSRRARLLGEVKLPAAVRGGRVECRQGQAAIFQCGQADLLSFIPVSEMGGGRGVETNTVWGWTDPETGREYAIVGRMDGTSFVDVTDPASPVYVGNLPKTAAARATVWRELKVYRNHVFIVSDGSGPHGMQVFDLTRLRGVSRPATFTEDAHYDRVNSAHNIAIDTASGFAYITGANGGGETCGGGLHMVDIRDPRKPTFVGCFADTQTGRQRTGYSHDVLCVVYRGPDQRYQGKQICIGSNETAISIADVTDKANPVAISRATYPKVGYTHQGWFTEDQRYFFVNDELDELQGLTDGTRTLIWDFADLTDPILAGEYVSQVKATDHNLYVRGNLMYQSNYVAGLRVLDVSDPKNPREVAFFDTVPVGDNGPGFGGTWNNYPFFKSGAVAVASMREGLFMVRVNPAPVVP